jgi:hypothetical protein
VQLLSAKYGHCVCIFIHRTEFVTLAKILYLMMNVNVRTCGSVLDPIFWSNSLLSEDEPSF